MKHIFKTARSRNFAKTINSHCSCGLFLSERVSPQTPTLRDVRRELSYQRADHLAEVKAAKA